MVSTYKYVYTVYQKSLLIENDVHSHSQNAQPVSQPHLQRLIVLIGHFSAGLLEICLMVASLCILKVHWIVRGGVSSFLSGCFAHVFTIRELANMINFQT